MLHKSHMEQGDEKVMLITNVNEGIYFKNHTSL